MAPSRSRRSSSAYGPAADAFADDKGAFRDAGADDIMLKPVTLRALRQLFDRWGNEPNTGIPLEAFRLYHRSGE